ncbi:polysaccharide biosynthesis protein [Tessaracoccus rhinocerotis]|uniref:Polysaccharide biosynthesis protein n=1 Tax=Tessaracoccus rhinocerotis TaxID=1689449 RepID=A0A553K0Z7_9ACTN|nr:nucleoside-diphosphate sugar epimerase/dehydratase [Tessaracoccus rhinocerotis]TRY18359.1 polysaccharide biosynthesis protein [Tessaracoccus rhinocerotis]
MATAALGLPSFARRILLVGWDCASWMAAMGFYILVRFGLNAQRAPWGWVALYLVGAIAIQVALGLLTHVYRGRSQVGSFSDAAAMGGLVFAAAVPFGLALVLSTNTFPNSMAFLLPPLALTIMAAGRWVFRALVLAQWQRVDGNVRTLVYGAGYAGHKVAKLVARADDPHYNIVGFLDDDLSKRFLRIGRHRVLGTGADLADVARSTGAQTVIVAMTHPDPQLLQRVSDDCAEADLELVVVPTVREMIGGRISLDTLREFKVEDLLGRRPIHTDLESIADYVAGKVVLVTGAGGSIGSELARQVHKLGPSKLVLLDRDESALHSVQLSLYGVGLLDTDDMVLCDIRDEAALAKVFESHRPDVVFHAAALKHLPMLERFPEEGWKTNVLGSLNVLRCAQAVGVTNFVNISTDKAADASSVLGRTKRVAERLTAWHAQELGLPYVSVRFGNVLGSRGSVLHTFRTQIERGGPLTVTDPEVTRYFMTIPEACELVLQAGAIGNPGDVAVLDMGEPIKIVDVAERLIAESGKDIEVSFTGLRPGEKLHEVLFSDLETDAQRVHPLISQVRVAPLSPPSVPVQRPTTVTVDELLAFRNLAESAGAPTPDSESMAV